MNLNPKQPSGTDAQTTSARRSSWLSKLAGRSDSGKAKDAKHSSSDTASVTSHTPLVTSGVGAPDTAAATTFERNSFVELMDKTKGMTAEQVKDFLAKHDQEHEEKFHEVATVGRWQWKFTDIPEGSKKFRGE